MVSKGQHEKAPIDAVVTWVDGSDPAHRQKLDAYLRTLGRRPSTASPNRFSDSGESAACIASLLRFAPWLRRIHIVTDNQEPPFMATLRAAGLGNRVRVVDHRVLFAGYEHCLPTFNIRSISSMLWRIPELAEQYLYLNDDFMLLRPMQKDDFFRDGRLVLRGHWNLQPQRSPEKALAHWLGMAKSARPGYREAQALAARQTGLTWRYFRVPHNPHPQSRNLLSEWFEAHTESLQANCNHRLRSGDQFLTDALCTHLALSRGQALIDNHWRTQRLLMETLTTKTLQRRLRHMERDRRAGFVCLQNLERAEAGVRKRMLDWVAHRVGTLEAVASAATETEVTD